VVETVASRHPINRRRVYLFGYSGGGHFALQMAVAEAEYFAGAAVYAGALRGELTNLVSLARRKIPIALYAGSEDKIVPVNEVSLMPSSA
jgi:polyhydroxybutyrate depolymerase